MMASCFSQAGGEMTSNLSNDIVRYIWGHLKSRVGYLVHYEKKVDKLKKTLEDLQRKKNDLQRRLQTAERNGEVVDDVVTAWVNEFNEFEGAVLRIVAEVGENKRCFMDCCPNFVWRYNLGKQAAEKMVDADELKENVNFTTVSQPRPPHSAVDSMPIGDFKAFTSIRIALDNVMEAMRDKRKQLIGIYGMGGVGKTTLMDELGRQFSKNEEFGKVVKVVVSQNPSIAQVRRDIASALGLELSGEGELAAQSQLRTMLKKEAKIVILMDDIWARLELRDIGIPIGDEHSGCKILFTTRTLETCQQMESHASIKVDVLSEGDSWTLFKSKVGDVLYSADLESVARKVAAECGGLPLAIVVVGRALSGCNQKSVWDSALMRLERSIPDELPGVEDKLYKSLELSYNYIENADKRLLFLFCCLFPEDYEISEEKLTWYAVGEGFLRDVYTLDEARREVHLLVQGLINSCLLISTERERSVKMHDVVRDVAIYIASKRGDCFFVKAGLAMRHWPESSALEVCKRVSLMDNNIETLPDQPNCPELLTLLLNSNLSLSTVPGSFFQRMPALTVLDLSDTSIESLPSSLSLLTNLRSLCLGRCNKLRDISLIGQLKKLEILGLRRCRVKILPESLETLTDLKLLDLSYSTSPGFLPSPVIPPNLLCKLSRLEELFMFNCVLKEAYLEQIGSMKRLVNLQVYVSDAKYLSQDVEALDGWKNLKNFSINAGIERARPPSIHEKFLYLRSVSCPGNWTQTLLTKAENLTIDDCDFDPTAFCDFVNVKTLRLDNCRRVGTLIKTSQATLAPNAFADLEHLKLSDLVNLEDICQGEVPALSFKRLRTLYFHSCDKLVCAMPCNLLQRAHGTLRQLWVSGCGMVQEIFNSEGLTEELVMLPELEYVDLQFLPNLSRVWGGILPPGSLPKLTTLKVYNCKKLEDLFSKKSLHGHRKLFPPGTFANLKELEVGGCSCRHLLPTSLAHELQNLEKLTVSKNLTMEVIIEAENGIELDAGSFPRLKELKLWDLPRLERFYRNETAATAFSWPLLEFVWLSDLPNLSRLWGGILPPGSLPKLTTLNVDNCNKLEDLFSKQSLQGHQKLFPPGTLANLKYLTVCGCPCRHLLPTSLAHELHNLEMLMVEKNPKMEVIIEAENGIELDAGSFPRLKLLELRNLPKLESFYRNETAATAFSWPLLEFVSLFDLPNLSRLWGGILPPGSLPKLTTLQVCRCNKLEDLFSKQSLQGHQKLFAPGTFANLKELEVVGCPCRHLLPTSLAHELRNLEKLLMAENPTMEVIIEAENGIELDAGSFPRLKELILIDLPRLESFYRNETAATAFSWPLLEIVRLVDLPNLGKLWGGILPPGGLPKLTTLEVYNCNKLEDLFSKQSLQGHQKLFPPGTFANLKELHVGGCPCRHLLPTSLAHELRKLEKLKVEKNPTMEVIIEADNGIELDAGSFPRLKELHLRYLPRLESFYRNETAATAFSWPLLEELHLESCPCMKRFPIGLGSAPKLKEIRVGDDDDDDVEWLQGLEWGDASIPSRFQIIRKWYEDSD